MKLYFVTSNHNKFNEAKRIIPYLEQLELEIEEIQELDSKKIIEHKLNEAQNKINKNIVVEDISLSINSLNGLPGPLIKWFMKAIGPLGFYNLVKSYEDKTTIVTCHIGALIENKLIFYNSEIEGKIVEPRGENGFAFDSIFVPNGSNKTFAEMNDDEKEKYNMRADVYKKLKEYLKEFNYLPNRDSNPN